MRSSTLSFFDFIFYVSWIFIGNYIFLNLFLAILLDGFTSEVDDDDDDEDVFKEKLEKKLLTLIIFKILSD